MSVSIDELTILEKRLVLEHTSALTAMANKPPGLPFALTELSRMADIYIVLQAVRSELSCDSRTRDGVVREARPV